MKTINRGNSTFEVLRTNDYVYIDKTKYLLTLGLHHK